MVIKLKNWIKNNRKVKIISIILMILSLSICFEALFDLRYNFVDDYYYSDDAIPRFYLFGPANYIYTSELLDDYQIIALVSGILFFICLYIYKLNKNTNYKFFNKFMNFISKFSIESMVSFLGLSIFLRFKIWCNVAPFYDTELIIMDTIILFLFIVFIKYVIINKDNLKSKTILYKLIKDAFDKSNNKSVNKKISLTFIVSLLIQFIGFSFLLNLVLYNVESAVTTSLILCIASLIIYAYIYKLLSKKLDYINYISKNIDTVKNGDLGYKLDIIGNDNITKIASSINDISSGLENALSSAIKSEKMKTELITNVSHDLKTPLTSIINYVDILKNNELDTDTIKDYITILDKKSKRLKTLVEDIFEASKISSGDLELNIEKSDVKELLIQSMVELEDKIEKSNLDFILDIPEEPIFIMVDGKRTWRVFENLINNILKYSLNGTRVYIDIFAENEDVSITFKNISNHKLNIKSDELLERFRRGDVSRNTEGSGLGLSIAQNIVNLQNGTLKLYIDGDLFKVIVKFKQFI